MISTQQFSWSFSSPQVSALLHRINHGEEAAFTSFYTAYAGRMFRLLITLTRGRQDVAEDILQIVMIRLAKRRLPIVETEQELWNWLARVTRNAWIDFLRREIRRQKRERDGFPGSGHASQDPGMEAVESEPHTLLAEALASLSEQERRLIEGRYVAGFSISQLAEQCNASYKSIESKLARTKRKLRNLLSKHEHE